MNFLPQPRLLLIDDHREVLRALQLSLELEDFDVQTAITTHEAARLLSVDRFDLVICDLAMPEMSGIEFHRKMSSHLNLPPFLFCSGMAMEPMEKPFPPGVAGFIAKPFLVSDLVSMLKRVLIPANFERNSAHKDGLNTSTKSFQEIIP